MSINTQKNHRRFVNFFVVVVVSVDKASFKIKKQGLLLRGVLCPSVLVPIPFLELLLQECYCFSVDLPYLLFFVTAISHMVNKRNTSLLVSPPQGFSLPMPISDLGKMSAFASLGNLSVFATGCAVSLLICISNSSYLVLIKIVICHYVHFLI